MTLAAAVDVAGAVAALARGEVVAIPTETFHALCVDALSVTALEKLLALKGRSAAHTLSVLIGGLDMLPALVRVVPPRAQALIDAHWPGPLTLALPAQPGLPAPIVSERGLVAVRWSPSIASEVARALGRPITATSANPTGTPPLRTAAGVEVAFPGVHVVAGDSPGGLPSTLAAVGEDDVATVLRPGPIAIP